MKDNHSKYYNSDGSLTAWALALGYIERDGETTLSKTGFETCYLVTRRTDTKIIRETARTYGAARKLFKKMAAEI